MLLHFLKWGCARAIVPALALVILEGQGSPAEAQVATKEMVGASDAVIERLDITVRTGDDDLRRDSRFLIELRSNDGEEDATSYLNCDQRRGRLNCLSIPAHARREYSWPMARAVPVSGVAFIRVYFSTGKPSPFDSDDNWDLAEFQVRAVVRNARGDRRTVTLVHRTQSRGNLVHRFKGDDSWQVPVEVTR